MKKGFNFKFSWGTILLLIVIIPVINLFLQMWEKDEGVIIWDIKSYYAYLPATIIYNDLSLEFMDEDPDFFGKWIWPIETPTGKRCIVTSMGLSFLYSPFFLTSHAYASLSSKYEANGYTVPYHVGLIFSAFFYFILGMYYLRKVLKRFFSENVTALTLFLVALGTNLFYYTTYEAPMAHCYSFALISIFFYFVIKWHDKKTIKRTIIIGAIGGLVTLIKPTNIIILLSIPLYGIKSFKDLKKNLISIFSDWKKLLVMIVSFVIIWMPQFIYWKYVSGSFLYFSYGEIGGKFFFNNPQIFKFLFSYGKGLFVYTPIMFIAVIGFIFLWKNNRKLFWSLISIVLLSIYILSSWWCWWFGGSFGQRSMIDFYGLLAFPLAALIQYFSTKNMIFKITIVTVLLALAGFNLFQIQQYRHKAIHYWLMNKEAYWENFLRLKPSEKYWHIITLPDYEKARKGIYVREPNRNKKVKVTDDELINFIVEKKRIPFYDSLASQYCKTKIDSSLQEYAHRIVKNKQAEDYYNQLKIKKYKTIILAFPRWHQQVKTKAQRKNIDFNYMLDLEAQRVYSTYGEKYDNK